MFYKVYKVNIKRVLTLMIGFILTLTLIVGCLPLPTKKVEKKPQQTTVVKAYKEQPVQAQNIVTKEINNKYEADKTEKELLARVAYSEARGESFKGKVAVVAVVLNRLDSNKFPDSICEVIFQKNAFTAVQDGQYSLKPDKSCYKAVEEALTGKDPTNGAVYYYNPNTATSKWIFTRKTIKKIGNHVFAK